MRERQNLCRVSSSPCLPVRELIPPEGPDWIAEVKWDGYRAIAIIEQSKVRLRSRNGLSLGKKFEMVVAELQRLDLDSAIFDGEIVAVDQDGIPRFELSWERSHTPSAFEAQGAPEKCSFGKRNDPVFWRR
jgi:ATP-dependent DNA ligase